MAATSQSSTSLRVVRAPSDTVPNGTILGVGAPFGQSELDAAVVRVRLAEASKPPPMRGPGPEVTKAPHEAARSSGRWKAFEDIGLKPNRLTSKANKLLVTSYRVLGFAILTLIVVALIGYISTTLFYYFSHTWITPVAVSANDEKVVALQAELSGQQSKREAMADELDQADRAVAAEQQFQLEFAKAIAHDLDGRKVALDRVRGLARAAASARAEIRRSNDAYAASSQRRMKDELDAGLIDRHDMLAGKYQLAQISSSSLSLAEREAEFAQRATELSGQTNALDALLGDGTTNTALSYDVLQIKRQYDTSKRELVTEIRARSRLSASLARQDKIIQSLKQSAYLRAVSNHDTIAFVPYGNLPNATKAAPLYACKIGMVACRQVGAVVEVLPGEVTFKHPRRDKMVRGQMIVLRLDPDEASAAEDDVLFVGGAPLFL